MKTRVKRMGRQEEARRRRLKTRRGRKPEKVKRSDVSGGKLRGRGRVGLVAKGKEGMNSWRKQ